MRRPAKETREHILAVAHDLFYWHSIKGTGVDTIATAAEVAPATLYRLFTSKDELVAAYIQRASGLYKQWFLGATAEGEPADRILSLFDALIEQVQPEHCRGCPFLMAMAELPDASTKAHTLAVETKMWVRERIGELTGSDVLADQIFLIMEGVYASVQSHGADGPARQARGLVELLLTSSLHRP
ncbi:TetR/AcrR family transcriptional regulator [Catenulispora rubra]|uniref:TetR/AcrR family transcriptional regulator n=1 Tax=Catenulispora rubra TaxID=280293 RepID=UPI0018920E3D|nr:TetR/AcrR family transcriptional regulator [Catenulispora rubra]